jgi:hypothetical protein
MASWTDKIPTFNPYVQQLPVDAMVKVGMAKQAQYEEGVQKIQTSIDNIAGLDVANDVDKKYLQSKLDTLGNNLRGVAAGDFSNFQLVNSVNGMTKQISKDKNVINAVGSTAWLRKQQAEMEKSVSEGKSSQSNIYDFNDQANKYLSSDKVGEKFNGRYTQYTDVKKKAMEAIKALHPNLQKYDIPFEVDSNGKMNTRKIADAMKRYKIEGVDENQIQQAITASMTPDDLNQLRIDSKYEFRGIGPEQLVIKANSDYNLRKKQTERSLELLSIQKKTTTDPTELEKIDTRIEKYKELLGKDNKPGLLSEQLVKNIEQANINPDDVKYSIYKDGFIQEFANAFKWQGQEEEAVTSPYKEQQNFVTEMKHKQQVENRQRYEFGVNTQFKQAELQLKQQEIGLKAEENAMKKAELYGADSPWTTLGNQTDNESQGIELFTNHIVSVDDSIKSDKQALADGGYDEREINGMLNRWSDAQGVVSKANIPADAIKLVQSIAKNQNYVKQLNYFEKKSRTEAEKEAGVTDIINKNLQGKTGLTFSHKGERVSMSPRELIDVKLAETETKVRDNQGHLVTGKLVDIGKLNPKQIKYAEAIYGRSSFGRYVNGELLPAGYSGNPTASIETRTQIDQLTRPHVYAADKIKGSYNKAEEIYKTKIGASANSFVPQIKAVANPKGEVPPMALQGLNQLIIAQQAKGIATDDEWDFGTASSYLTDKLAKDTRVIVKQDGDSYEIQLRNLANPDKVQRLKVSGQQVAAYLGDKYINANTQESTRMTIGKGNTDINRTNVPTNALLQKQFGAFPGIQRLQITANLKQDRANPDLYIPTVYVKNKKGGYNSFELSGDDRLSRVGYEQGIQNLNSLNDEILLKSLKQAYPKFDFSTLDY